MNTNVDIDKLLVSLFNMTPISKENKYLLQEALKKQGLVFNGTEITSIKESKEPLFNAGDWVVYDGWVTQIVRAGADGYVNSAQGFIPKDREDCMRLWNIEDTKSGDVLFHSDSASNGIFIFKEIIDRGFAKEIICYCDYDSEDHFCLGEHHTCCWTNAKILRPATKEQRDTLMKAMTDAGYTFDFEKKELKKIKQKPAWSEEDERIYQSIMDDTVQENQLDGKQIDWLRDIKYRHFSQSQQEWSEEDETRLTNTIIMLKEGASLHFNKKDITKTVDWLKTLKERCTWKPSDEQMEALDNFIYAKYPNIEKYEAAVKSLYQDLKKLREE